MKKIFVILSMALMPLVALTACGDDDDPPATTDLAAEVAGNYPSAAITASAPGLGDLLPDGSTATVVITRQSADKVSLKLNGFAIMGDPTPIDIAGVSVAGTEENVAISLANGTVDVLSTSGAFAFEDVPVTIANSSVKNGALDLTVNLMIDLTGGGLPITVEVTGNLSVAQ